MSRYRKIGGVRIPYTPEEEIAKDAEEKAWADGALDRAIANLREKRNSLLASSDWTGLVDVDMTNEKLAEWKLYRQHLRNLPDGLDTEDKVKEATWPTKPA